LKTEILRRNGRGQDTIERSVLRLQERKLLQLGTTSGRELLMADLLSVAEDMR
jgi:hypothetical protein